MQLIHKIRNKVRNVTKKNEHCPTQTIALTADTVEGAKITNAGTTFSTA